MKQKILLILTIVTLLNVCAMAQTPAAEHTADYIPLLKDKKVGLVANHTSLVGTKHLLDVLLDNKINVVRLYAPEHGFRGTAEAGEKVNNATDEKTGLPIVSLYGANKKPTAEQLKGIDCMVFDMQDVGTRFYTYLSTMHYVMEACAENNVPFIVLDRPNPNGFYIDGPILDSVHKSFIGMHPIPIVHGMTLGELAQMINGEGWLKNKVKCELTVVKCHDYAHQSKYKLPVKPSPNLPNMQAVYLYPSLCLFEGTALSVGRGTDYPFQIFGHPAYKGNKKYSYTFTPKGASKPVLNGQLCYGMDLHTVDVSKILNNQLNLDWVINAYKDYKPRDKFFTAFFYKLSGTSTLRKQIEEGKTVAQIRASWKAGLEAFKAKRKKYLLYED